jgi:hypothetical protein
MIELSAELATTIAMSLIATYAALQAKVTKAENARLTASFNALKESNEKEMMGLSNRYTADLNRVHDNQDELWKEIKLQSESLRLTREAVVELNSGIKQLNVILPKLEQALNSKVDYRQCELIRENYIDHRSSHSRPIVDGRRVTDPQLVGDVPSQ